MQDGWRSTIIGAVLAAVAVCYPDSARACSPIGYEHSGRPRLLERNIARAMVERASYIELALAERREPVDLETLFAGQLAAANPEGRTYLLEEIERFRPFAATVTFRVIETLKGPGVGTFSMNALVGEASNLLERRRWAEERGDFSDPADYWLSDALMFDESFVIGVCEEPPHADIGARYLVFRDENGRILDAQLPFSWRHSGQGFTLAGPTYQEVFEPGDPWVQRVRREVIAASRD